MRILIVTGLSGAGKSTALRALEDVGYFCVDNMPLPLVGKFIELFDAQSETEKVAMVIDAREREFLRNQSESLAQLRAGVNPVETLFLDAADDVLIRRYSETRRRHPLGGDDLRGGIARERAILQQLRESADAVVDTGNLTVHQLKGIIQERYAQTSETLAVTLLSFGFKYGLPAEADLVFDVRFLPNPYFVESLSPMTGLEPDVASYVLDRDDSRVFLEHTTKLLRFLLPRFQREGKSYLTIAVGCTGGRHRSVAVCEEMNRRLDGWDITLRHRDADRAGQAGRAPTQGGA